MRTLNNPKILVTCKQMQVELPKYIDTLHELGYEVLAPDLETRQFFTADELLSFGDEVVGLIAGDDELSAAYFDRVSASLRAVVRWGIGMDSVDHAAALRRGVVVLNTPGVFSNEVSDAAMGYVLGLARGVVRVDRAMRLGSWTKFEGVTLMDKTIGIVGYGGIGRAIARRAAAFGMSVRAHDPFGTADEFSGPLATLSEVRDESDFLVLACPLNAETYHLVSDNFINGMKDTAFVVNVARGPVVDEHALTRALGSGRLAGAALDVFEVEPLPDESILRNLDSVILGSHNASNTREGVARASLRAVELLVEELEK